MSMRKIAFILTLLFAVPTTMPVLCAMQQTSTEIAETTPELRVVHGGIEISNPYDIARFFYIYSITGQMVKSLEVTDGTVTVNLPQGCYIVKCDKWSKKIIVR